MFKSSVPVLTDTITATAAIKGDQLVGYDGQPTANEGLVLGVAHNDAAIGEPVSLMLIGLRDLIAGGPISKSDALMSNADGNPVLKAGAGIAFGRALNDAALGERVRVLVFPA